MKVGARFLIPLLLVPIGCMGPALEDADSTGSALAAPNGLAASYYEGTAFDTLALSRTDATVNFNWGTGAPAAGLPADQFSVRWTGQVLAQHSETYTFYTRGDDGMRLWVDGKELVDDWTNHGATEHSGTIALSAGQRADVKLEYFENIGQAVAQLSWSSPSTPKAIIPSSQLFTGADPPPPPPPNDPLADLDPTGTKIPDTNYAIPSGAIFLATNGSDANAGTQTAPVATLNRAIALVPSSGTIVVRGGTYRDWYNNGTSYQIAAKPFTLQAYPHEQPWFDGTDVIAASKWTSDGAGHFAMPWSTPQFCNGGYYTFKFDAQPTNNSGPCAHFDMYGDLGNPAASDPQMVFVDGKNLHEVLTLAEVNAGTFYYDWSARKMYVGTNPSGHTVELASRPIALVLGGPGGNKLRGVGFRRYASNEFTNITGSAVYVGATHTTVEDCVFTLNAGGGLSLQPEGGLLQHSVLANNGFDGAGGNGHADSGVVDGLVIQHNVVAGNNTEMFGTNCTISCAQAGIKNAHLDQFTIRGNLFENTHGGSGYWCDTDCTGGVIVNNISHDNQIGLFLELSDKTIFASNLTYSNTQVGIRVLAGNTKVYNNTLVDSGTADLWVYDDSRGPTSVAPNTVNIDVENNIFSNSDNGTTNVYASNSQTGPNTYFTGLDYNSYYRSAGCTKPVFDWQDTVRVNYKAISALTTDHGWEKHAQDICTGADPFFVDAASRNYVVRSGSVAYQSAKPLPADVATALGLTAGAVYSRGAIAWPGHP